MSWTFVNDEHYKGVEIEIYEEQQHDYSYDFYIHIIDCNCDDDIGFFKYGKYAPGMIKEAKEYIDKNYLDKKPRRYNYDNNM